METFANIVRTHAQERGAAAALTFAGRTESFAELDAASSRMANLMAAQGVTAGDRVGVLSKNRAEYFHAIVAASKLGATLVGLNWRLSKREIAEIVSDADPSLVLVDETGATLIPEDADLPVLQFGTQVQDAMADMPADDPGHEGAAEEVALILYTSGTTGMPKGAMLTNRAMSYTARLAEAWGMGPDSVNLVAMPLFHIGGCGYGSSTLFAGGHTVLLAEVNVDTILRLIPEHRVTHTFLVPAVVQMMLNAKGLADADLTSLQLMMYGASPMGDVLLRKAMAAMGCGFMHAYGMTESAGTVVILPPESHDPGGPEADLLKSCGQALPWVDLRVVAPGSDGTTSADPGEVGEIWLRTPMLMDGYWKNPKATAEVMTDDGWFRTGDAAYLDERGHVFLFDRYKDMIISGGENIYPAEIENVLNGHDAVAQVGVIGVTHDKWGETPLAVVVLKDGADVGPDDLIAYTRANLATYKCPTRVEIVGSLPHNASGKLLKPELRRLYGSAA